MKRALGALWVLTSVIGACGSKEEDSPASGGSGGQASSVTGGAGAHASPGGTANTTAGSSGASTAGVLNAPGGAGGTTSPGGAGAPAVSGGSPSAGSSMGGSVALGGSAAGGTTSGGASTGGGPSAGSGGAGPILCKVPTGAPTAKLITFNDNGGWCWYQDERVVVDTKNNKMFIGTIASGGSRDGNVDATVYDLTTGESKRAVLGDLSVDDHNAPGFVITDGGKVVAMYATHRENCNSYFATYDGSAWSKTATYDWKGQGCPWPGANTNMITYANPWNLSSEKRILSAVRSVETSPAFLVSTDEGASFKYLGRLTGSPQQGYVAGYYKYWGNGVDRIDFLGTEAHPRDNDNSLYHGYLQGGKLYDSMGKVVDETIDGNAQRIESFTQVFKTGTTVGGVKLEHMWNHDLVRYADGTVAMLGQGRVTGTGSDDPDKRFIYSRFDGTSWKTTYLGKAGTKLYSSEQDYTGLSALHPDNPTIIYISSPYDPRDSTGMTKTNKREIYQGTTCDNGATFTWTPITENSSQDNIRPVVPKWDANHTALLWMQGTYTSAQSFSEKIVGLILEN